MTQEQYTRAEAHMQRCMRDNVHDSLHIYRVLNYALQIADGMAGVDMDVVILASLLHDIGRVEESANPAVSHADVGSKKALDFLIKEGYPEATAQHVADSIATHSYKKGEPPQSMEAKILFDADKLDLTGAVGVARAILFGGQIDEPIYRTGEDSLPTTGHPEEPPSLFREYNRKLSMLQGRFHTERARAIAQGQQQTMDAYFRSLFTEVGANYSQGRNLLKKYVV